MGLIFADSFDFYAQAGDMLAGVWDGMTATLSSVATRFGVGLGMRVNNGGTATKILPGNYTTIFVGFAFRPTFTISPGNTTQATGFTLGDGASVQLGIFARLGGDIVVTSGSFGSSVLATWPIGLLTNQWYYLQFKITINNTTGSVEARLNGNSVNDFTATNINTRNGTANSFVNRYVATSPFGTNNGDVDDLALWDTTGVGPLVDWTDDMRAIQIMPRADTAQKQFTLGGLATPITVAPNNFISSGNLAANTIIYSKFTVTQQQGGTVSTLTVAINASFAGSLKGAIYSDNAGTPGTLLGSTATVTNPGVNGLLTFGSPVALPRGTYWLAIVADAIINLSTTTAIAQYSQALAFASAFPGTAGGASSATNWKMNASVALYNASGVSELLEDGDTTYVQDATIGDFDLYTCDQLATTPAAIYAVGVKEFIKKTDANFRAGGLVVKSGAFQEILPNSSGLNLNTTNQWIWKYYEQDPNTGLQWQPGAVNSLQAGPKTTG